MSVVYDWCGEAHELARLNSRFDEMTDVRILTELLGGSALSQLLQRGEAPASWCQPRPRGVEQWTHRAKARAGERDWKSLWDILAPAFAATGAAAERLARVRDANGIVVTTGQQPGLFGGPIYTWSKAMSALALANALERETGIPCAPVFWAATDDADFAEANFTVLGTVGGAQVIRSEHAPTAGTPMALAPLGDLTVHRARLRAACGSVADSRALEQVDRAYGVSTATVGAAYVQLLRGLLAPLGVAVLDASHDAVRQASEPVLRKALACSSVLEDALNTRRREIEQRGFEPQVEDMKGLSLVFLRENGIKRRITVAEASGIGGSADVVLTPNVVLRPVVEASILPTVGYLGGPGEVAYFAQVSAVAAGLDVEQPLVLPRWSCTLIEPHVAALLDRFGITHDALAVPDVLEGRVARNAMNDDTAAALAELRAAIERSKSRITPEATGMGIHAAVEGAGQGLLHRVDRLERRLLAAIKRREHSELRDVATLRAALYPLGKRQERALNLIPALSRHGYELLAEMRDAADVHANALIHGE